jgi:succinate dehydrogenase / fumarate reductase cytochrome b subunit
MADTLDAQAKTAKVSLDRMLDHFGILIKGECARACPAALFQGDYHMAGAKNRPIAPHLSIWKPGPAMVVSILHRISGDGLALVGLPLLLWWLAALANGPDAYATLASWVWAGEPGSTAKAVTSILGKVTLVGLSWSFFEHLLSGLRHFVMDIGAGYELRINAIWSWIVMLGSIVLTAAFWAAVLS